MSEAYASKTTSVITSWTRPQLSPHLLDLLADPASEGDGTVWTPGESGQRIAEVQVSATMLGVTWLGVLAYGRRSEHLAGLRERVLRVLREKAGERVVAIKG